MSKSLQLGSLSIPITQYASQGNAVLGIRDSGKSYTATYLAEQLLKAKIPFIAFDPSGVWKFLRVAGNGAGFPVVVAGGKEPDLPLTPASAPEIVRAAMRSNVSLVIDLYSIGLSKADWSRIVESCVRVLLYENGDHGLRHVFIEEAAEFCPQQVQGDKARVYAEVEKLARIGGNALLGYTLINQRAEQVNKAVLELCDCLFLHRQKGKNSLNSLSKWLEYSQGGETKEIIKGLPTLPSGECWVWPANADHAVRVKMPEKQSFHPDRRALIANPKAATGARVDAGQFVEQLKGTLDKVLQESKANDPKELKARIAQLEQQLKTTITVAPSTAQMEQAQKQGFERGVEAGMADLGDAIRVHVSLLYSAVEDFQKRLADTFVLVKAQAPTYPKPAIAKVRAPTRERVEYSGQDKPVRIELPRSDLAPVEQKILNALAELEDMHAAAPTRELLALLSGYGHPNSKGFANSLGSLRSKGLIEGLALTAEGRAIAQPPDAPRTPAEIQTRIVQLLSPVAGRVLQPLLDAYPKSMSREELAAGSGYGHVNSKGFSNTLGQLSGLGFVKRPATGQLAAASILFLE